MKKHRWIPWIDVIIFAGVPMLFTVAVIASLFFEQLWPPAKIGIAIAVPMMAWAIFGALIFQKWKARPSFTLVSGTRVWVANGIDVTAADVASALTLYANRVARAHTRLDLQTVLSMLGCARIEFRSGSIGGKNGLQKGNGIIVNWLGGFGGNATFHELHHMVDELLLGVPVDYKHERAAWWDLVGDIKRAWMSR